MSEEVSKGSIETQRSGEGAGNGTTAEVGISGTGTGSQNNILWRKMLQAFRHAINIYKPARKNER